MEILIEKITGLVSTKPNHSLTISIKNQGLINPIIVSEKDGFYQLISGSRRVRAAQELGWKTIEAKIISKLEPEWTTLAENLVRSENPIKEMQAIKKLIDIGFTPKEIATNLGISRSQVDQKLRLQEIPEDLQTAVETNKVSFSAIRELMSTPESIKNELIENWRNGNELSLKTIKNSKQAITSSLDQRINQMRQSVVLETDQINPILSSIKVIPKEKRKILVDELRKILEEWEKDEQ